MIGFPGKVSIGCEKDIDRLSGCLHQIMCIGNAVAEFLLSHTLCSAEVGYTKLQATEYDVKSN